MFVGVYPIGFIIEDNESVCYVKRSFVVFQGLFAPVEAVWSNWGGMLANTEIVSRLWGMLYGALTKGDKMKWVLKGGLSF